MSLLVQSTVQGGQKVHLLLLMMMMMSFFHLLCMIFIISKIIAFGILFIFFISKLPNNIFFLPWHFNQRSCFFNQLAKAQLPFRIWMSEFCTNIYIYSLWNPTTSPRMLGICEGITNRKPAQKNGKTATPAKYIKAFAEQQYEKIYKLYTYISEPRLLFWFNSFFWKEADYTTYRETESTCKIGVWFNGAR